MIDLSEVLIAYAATREGNHLAGAVPRAVEIGVGKARAAATLAAELARQTPRWVVLIGVAGAYPERHSRVHPVLDVGDLCVVGESVLADEGACDARGFHDLAAMGFGTVGPFAADPAASAWLARATGGVPVVRAATVSTCSGVDELSATLAVRSGAHIETMESAAVALVCSAFAVRWVELRCISNRTGARDAGGFALGAAADAAQQALLAALRDGGFDWGHR